MSVEFVARSSALVHTTLWKGQPDRLTSSLTNFDRSRLPVFFFLNNCSEFEVLSLLTAEDPSSPAIRSCPSSLSRSVTKWSKRYHSIHDNGFFCQNPVMCFTTLSRDSYHKIRKDSQKNAFV